MSTVLPVPAVAAKESGRQEKPRRFYPQLDGLRGVAVVWVMLYHTTALSLPESVRRVCALGWMGVDVFFVLSGFLISSILLETRPGARGLGLFIARRTLRTWPLYFLLLGGVFVTLGHAAAGGSVHWWRYLVFLQNYQASFWPQSLGPTWSLCVEEHFYLLWPLVIFLVPRRRLLWVTATIFCSLPVWRGLALWCGVSGISIYTETQFHLDGLVAGTLVALWLGRGEARPRHWMAGVCVATGAAASVMGFWRGTSVIEGHNSVMGFTFLAVGFAGLLLFLLQQQESWCARLLRLRPVAYVGRISYGIYLLHMGLMIFCERWPLLAALSRAAGVWGALLLRMALAIAVASLSYRFFELPILRLKDRLR